MSDPLRIAILIDADNISARYIPAILEETGAYGVASIRRVYGDWTNPRASKWKDELLNNSLTPMQQFENTTGKNSTDSAMIIDAMDILYSGDVDGFCIVSSDSDFTRLASRLRESGALVLGMGEEKTPLAFRKACTKFVVLENLLKEDNVTLDQEHVLSIEKVERAIFDIIVSKEGVGRRTRLADIGNELSNMYSDFDVRNYGYTSLSRFLGEMSHFDLEREGTDYFITLSKTGPSKQFVSDYIKEVLVEMSQKRIGLSELGSLVRERFPDFEQRSYGYTQFSKFVASIEGVEVFRDDVHRQSAVLSSRAL